ncbi:MAG TPA: N-acetyltransferase [Christensenellaceae bacterium]|jgi:predicted GNAT family acetyltransferase|nr:N-acetyltransferase [Christensenellaceae bacterium]
MNIVFEENNKRVAAYDGEKLIGESKYNEFNNIWAANHTFVEPEYKGKGIAKQMLVALVEAARQKGKKIRPICPFIKSQFEKNEQWSDVKYSGR